MTGWRLHRARGVTLIEVLVALTIFSLVMTSLYVSFRTGMKAYNIGMTHSEGEQAARYTIAQVTDDLRNVYYKSALLYNQTRRQAEALLQQQERQRIQSGAKGNAMDESLMPELGPKIDLAFRCQDGGDTDDLSFVRRQTGKHGEERKMWGLARVRYFVHGNALYRALDDIMAPETDENGNEIPKETKPSIDKVANNVKKFNLKFAYYFDKEWKTAEDWDSNAARYRNPADEEEDAAAAGGVQSASKLGQTAQPGQSAQSAQGQKSKQPDDIPAWMEIEIVFADAKKIEVEKKYRQIVQMPSSQETYVPEEAQGASLQSNVSGSNRERTLSNPRRAER